MEITVGLLALQGAIEPHALKLKSLGVASREVRTEKDLSGLAGIILPGGESTAMIKLLDLNRLWDPLQKFTSSFPVWGACAGAILLATRVKHPEQKALGIIDVTAERNGFGRQVDSFIAPLELSESGKELLKSPQLEGVFIRAPRFTDIGKQVNVLATWKGEPTMLESKNCLITSFHPELSSASTVHRYFVEKCRKAQSQ